MYILDEDPKDMLRRCPSLLHRGFSTRASVFGSQTVKDLINLHEHESNVLAWTVDENTSVFDATRQMVDNRTGCLCVTRENKVVGIITERDYLTKVLHTGRKAATTKVNEIATMDDKLIVAAPSDTIQDCVDVLVAKNIRHLPVADEDGDVIALLDIKDVAKSLVDEHQETLHTLHKFRLVSKMPIHDG